MWLGSVPPDAYAQLVITAQTVESEDGLVVHFRTRTNTVDIETPLPETLQKFKHQSGLPTYFQIHGKCLLLPTYTG